MASDGALLALVVEDPIAIQVLAAWAALELPLELVDADQTIAEVSDLSGVPVPTVRLALRRLRAARCLADDGISELADRMLQSHVQQRLVSARKKGS